MNTKADFNCYTLCVVDNTTRNFFIACITFVFQVFSTLLVALDTYDVFVEAEFFTFPESGMILPFVIIFFIYQGMMDFNGSLDFWSVFASDGLFSKSSTPARIKWALGADFLVNRCLLFPLIGMQILVIAASEARMDIVMDSLALGFLLELGDMSVDIDDDKKDDIVRSFLRKKFKADVKRAVAARKSYTKQGKI